MTASRLDRLVHNFYPESRYGGFTDVDGTINFYTRVGALIDPTATVLDFGCGRGAFGEDPVPKRVEVRDLRQKARRVIGLDVDPAAATNSYVHEFRHLASSTWPLADSSVDVCACDWVLEHVAAPSAFFSECRRVLKPGGHVCIRTVNRRSYVGLFGRLFPNSAHAGMLKRLQPERQPADVFPTFYRCNTKRKLESMLEQFGFDGHVYGHEAEPTYLEISPILFRLGVWHQRLAPRALAVALFAFARRGDNRDR